MQLTILSDDRRIAAACKDYWLVDSNESFKYKVKEVAERHDLDQYKLPKIVAKHSFVTTDWAVCTKCAQKYHIKSRNSLKNRLFCINWICLECHEEEEKSVNAGIARTLKQMRSKAKSSIPKIDSLGYKSRLFLLATIQGIGNETLSSTHALTDTTSCSLSPGDIFDEVIIDHLLEHNILLPKLDYAPWQVNIDSDFGIITTRCKFDFAYSAEELMSFMSEMSTQIVKDAIVIEPEFYRICNDIQILECISFLEKMLRDRSFHITIGQKTCSVIKTCLEDYSVSHTCHFIYVAARNASDYLQRNSVNKWQAANSVVGSISRYYEKALANNWNFMEFRRNPELSQSALSRVVFNTVLGTDDGGFWYPLQELLRS